MIKERKKEGSPSLKENTWARILEEAAVTEITFSTERRDGAQLFFVSQSLEEKSHTPVRTHTNTHIHTYLSDRTCLFPYFPICPQETNAGIFFLAVSSPSCPPSLSPTPSLSMPLGQSVHTWTHTSWHIHSSLPLPLSPSPSLAVFPRPHVHTHAHMPRVAGSQLLHCRKLPFDPPPSNLLPSLSLSLSPCISEYPSTTLNPHPSLRPISF